MPDGYDLHDGRLICEVATASAANAIFLNSDPVPVGKVWTFLSASYYPSATETRTVQWCVCGRSNYIYPIQIPVTISLGALVYLPLVTEGMELKLFPKEFLRIQRDVATAGSTMTMLYRYIETDLPYYKYNEPLNRVVQSTRKHGAVYRSSGGISVGSGPSGGGHGGSGGGDDGTPPPV